MHCPNCNAENRAGRRFCGGCGAALPKACPACNADNENDARFCGSCGAKLEEIQPPPRTPDRAESTGERRQVTVLFADLVGFTRLSRGLDAEDLHAVMARFFAAVDRVIASFGGHVDKHVGDAVMAVFGAPVAHADDPCRAARAAVEIHDAVAALGSELGRQLAVHVGIASGEVVAAGLGSDRHSAYTVLGDAVNLAARLVELAQPGQTLIADEVRRAVAQSGEFALFGEVTPRGLDRPLEVWLLTGIRGDAGNAAAVPFVGRIGELRQMTGILEVCVETGRGRALLLRGEAGIGKSRLVEEVIRKARSLGFAIHLVRVFDFGTAIGRDAARSLAHNLLGLTATSDEAARRTAVEAATPDMQGSSATLFLSDLLDLPLPLEQRAIYDAMDNATRNRGKQRTLAALLRVATARQPVLVVVEDIHWAESVTIAHLAALTLGVRDGPAALLMTTRIEGDPLDDSWRAATRTSPLTTIDLGPLAMDEALVLAGSFLDAGDRIAIACVERAEGNPLFLEQLLRHAESSEQTSVPATIQSLVLGRMDQLPPADRLALQGAAVIGQQFALDALRHILRDPNYVTDQLIRHHLVRPEEGEFLFAHALIREGIYGSLLKPRRRELHGRAAAWFAGRDSTLHAQHLDLAEDPAAPAAYLAAARARYAVFHYERALALVERGLAIANVTADHHALTCLRGDLLHDLGRTQDSIDAFGVASDEARSDAERCRAWIGLAAGLRVVDRYDDALRALDQAEAIAGELGDRARIHYLRGSIFFPAGRFDECRAQHALSLDLARRAGSVEGEARALSGLGDSHYAIGRMLSAREDFDCCVALCRQHGLGRIEVANRNMAALTRLFTGDLEGALAEATDAVRAAEQVGHQRAEMVASEITFMIMHEMGRTLEALPYIERALALSRSLGARRFESEDLTFVAQVRRTLGQKDEALELLEEALVISRNVGMKYAGPLILVEIAAATSDPSRRREALAEGAAVLASGAVSHCHFWFHAGAIDIHLGVDDWDAALHSAQALAEYTAAEPLPWSDFYTARGRALAAWGRGERDARNRAELQRLAEEAARCRIERGLPELERALAAG